MNDAVKFEPWIGERYREQRPRLLVLGQSHYAHVDATMNPGEFARRFTVDVVRRHLDGQDVQSMFTKLESMLAPQRVP